MGEGGKYRCQRLDAPVPGGQSVTVVAAGQALEPEPAHPPGEREAQPEPRDREPASRGVGATFIPCILSVSKSIPPLSTIKEKRL